MRRAFIWERAAHIPAGNEANHLSLRKSLARKSRNVRVEVLLWLRHSRQIGRRPRVCHENLFQGPRCSTVRWCEKAVGGIYKPFDGEIVAAARTSATAAVSSRGHSELSKARTYSRHNDWIGTAARPMCLEIRRRRSVPGLILCMQIQNKPSVLRVAPLETMGSVFDRRNHKTTWVMRSGRRMPVSPQNE
jgi:hypothetical protein